MRMVGNCGESWSHTPWRDRPNIRSDEYEINLLTSITCQGSLNRCNIDVCICLSLISDRCFVSRLNSHKFNRKRKANGNFEHFLLHFKNFQMHCYDYLFLEDGILARTIDIFKPGDCGSISEAGNS